MNQIIKVSKQEFELTSKIKRVKEFAFKAHAKQKYGNVSYEYHLEGVARNVHNLVCEYVTPTILETLICVAYLHDYLEDVDFTNGNVHEMKEAKIDLTTITLVLMLTHNSDETYTNYILRIKENKYATMVKLADLFFNKGESEKTLLNPKIKGKGYVKQRLSKYELAIEFLSREKSKKLNFCNF